MGRTSSKINDLQSRVAKLEQNEAKNSRDIKNLNSQVELLTDDRILQMLQETNSPYSNKPRYSYEEISNATGRSTGYISNLAKDNGLSRKKNLRTV